MTDALTPTRLADRWVFPDGRSLPVVAGGSDDGAAPAAAEPSAAPAAPDAGAAAPDAAPASTPNEPDALGDLPEGQSVFDRGYVERLRQEAAKYRTERNELNERLQGYDAFDGIDPEDFQVFADMAGRYKQGDTSGMAEMMQTIAQAILSPDNDGSPEGDAATAEKIGEAIDGATDADGKPLDPDSVQQMIADALAAKEAQEAEERAVKEVFAEIEAAGFKQGTPEGWLVLWHANNTTGGDIAAAAEQVRAYRQGIIDEYVQGVATGNRAPLNPEGVVATEHQPIQTMEDSHRAVRARLESLRNAT